mgnify:CR=1 FL=1
MAVFDGVTPAIVGAAGAGAAAGYEIERSLRFNSADSAYLNRTPSSAGNRRTWTWSGWVKRCDTTATRLLSTFTIPWTDVAINSSNQIQIVGNSGSGGEGFRTDAVLRDLSAWYHIVIAVDTTQTTATDRVKFYINGAQNQTITLAGGAIPQNYETSINATNLHHIGRSGRSGYGGIQYTNNYLTELHFIDGQALAASDFGEYDDNNVWQPKDCKDDLTYGTNGFYLTFADNTSTATLGTDGSGNSNTWTVNNFSVASGAGNDSLIDTPTNYTAASGNNGGNYCTLNPLKNQTQTLKNGNLESNGTSGRSTGTLYVSSGKFYWEFTAGTDYTMSGIESSTSPYSASYPGENDQQYALYGNAGSGLLYHNGSTSSFDGFVSGDVIGVALDMDNGNLYFYKNGSAMNSGNAAVTGLTGSWTANCRSGSGAFNGDTVFNFGQRPFAYTPPTGYKSLCTTNLPDPTIADGSTAMDPVIYTGAGGTQTISSLNFSPDFVWIKSRNIADQHCLFDTVRGALARLQSNSTNVEASVNQYGSLTAFNSDGFTLTAGSSSSDQTHGSGNTYVAWTWDGGTSTVSNTDGSITSNVRANASAGFSIVTYTGTGSNATFGHGLNAAPELVIVKCRSHTQNWAVYSSYASGAATPAEEYAYLNSTNGWSSTNAGPFWNNTSPTNSVVHVGTDNDTNGSSRTYVAYCFAPVAGYSAFGSYTGNGNADGPFVFTGFRPRWILFKASSITGDWRLMDTARDSYNPADSQLYPNNSDAEISSSSHDVDYLSNGFKVVTSSTAMNTSGATYIWAAFAEHPFKTARAR